MLAVVGVMAGKRSGLSFWERGRGDMRLELVDRVVLVLVGLLEVGGDGGVELHGLCCGVSVCSLVVGFTAFIGVMVGIRKVSGRVTYNAHTHSSKSFVLFPNHSNTACRPTPSVSSTRLSPSRTPSFAQRHPFQHSRN